MVMTSSQISGLVGAQQAMFGNFQSYAAQITPSYGGDGGGGQGGPGSPMMGGGNFQPPSPGYGSPYGVGMGVPPPPPPMPPTGYGPNPAMMQHGGMGQSMAGMGWMGRSQYGAQSFGERMMGTGLNAAGTMGTGAGYLNMGAGVAGMMGFGGLGMAALGGIPAMGAVAAAGYGVNQMGTGFRQRQGVNRVLRNQFGGMQGIGGGRGGSGFGTEEMGQISQMVREMGTEDLFTNVEELTRVMDKTAQMGLYRGVQSAKQFRTKFKETVDSLKEIAQTMGTSLEEASGLMQQGRSMGFFSGADINRNMMKTRFGAQASGLSVGQVQEMGQIGTQMGRTMGMRGRQGAQAMQSMGMNIAQQMQMGLMSDETVAEATGGLTGGEGATAMATQMLQMNDRWLSSGAGRVMMAGLWDPASGGINQSMMRRVQSGQVGLRELRTMGRQNIAQTGGRQSEFFSQEERLRGQLQEEGGGGLAFGAVGQHFAQRRGLQLEDPIVQRFLRKRFGMTQSQVEGHTQAFRNMPQAMERSRARIAQQMESSAGERSREMGGIQGLERRLSQHWERSVENPFRDLADRMTTVISRGVEQLVEDFEGRVKVQMTDQTKLAYEELAMWGSTDRMPGLGGGGGRRGSTSTDVSGLMGSGGGDVGLLRGAARALGTITGARGSESLLETAHGMGLGRMVGKKFRLRSQNKGRGQYEQRLGGGPGENIFGLGGATYATAGDIENEIREANAIRMSSAEDLGVDSGALDRMGTAARNAVMERYADPESAATYDRKNSRGLNTASRDSLAQKRIALIRSKDAEVDRRFAALDGNRDKEIALLRVIEEASGVAETTLAAPAGPSGVGSSVEGTMDEIRSWRKESISGLSGLRTGTKTTQGGGGILGGDSTTDTRLNLSQEVVRGLMEVDAVRENFHAWRFGDASEKRDALGRLGQLAKTKGGELSAEQQKALGRITATQADDLDATSGELSHFMGRYFKSVGAEGMVAITTRERELGRGMKRGLEEQHHAYATANREEAFNKLKEIARIRRGAQSKDDVIAAGKRERAFYAAYSGDEEVQDLLSRTPGMEYMAAGVGATARLAETLTTPGRGKSGRVGRLLEESLRAAGLEDLKISDAELANLSAMTKSGDTDLVYTAIQEHARKKGSEFLQKLQSRSKLIKGALKTGVDGVQDEEIDVWASRAGAGAAAKLRAESGGGDNTATSALQEKMLSSMKKQMLIQMEIARGVGGPIDEKLHAALVKMAYGTGGDE